MTFTERTAVAFPAEKALPGLLYARGWLVTPTGSANLPDDMHDALKRFRDSYGRPCLYRWWPDHLATRGQRVYAIDSKSLMGPSSNYAIEAAALDTYSNIETALNLPVLVVCVNDLKVLTVHIIKDRIAARLDGSATNGSGTSFVLVKKQYALDFNAYFGEPS